MFWIFLKDFLSFLSKTSVYLQAVPTFNGVLNYKQFILGVTYPDYLDFCQNTKKFQVVSRPGFMCLVLLRREEFEKHAISKNFIHASFLDIVKIFFELLDDFLFIDFFFLFHEELFARKSNSFGNQFFRWSCVTFSYVSCR